MVPSLYIILCTYGGPQVQWLRFKPPPFKLDSFDFRLANLICWPVKSIPKPCTSDFQTGSATVHHTTVSRATDPASCTWHATWTKRKDWSWQSLNQNRFLASWTSLWFPCKTPLAGLWLEIFYRAVQAWKQYLTCTTKIAITACRGYNT